MKELVTILAFVFGTAIGSFLNVVILRLPEGETLGGRSHCPHCRHTLGGLELVPLFSYLFLGGRCRHCRTRISPRYFIIELIAGLLFAWAVFWFYPATLPQAITLVKTLLVIAILIAVFVIDLEHYIILDALLLTGSIGVLLCDIASGLIHPLSLWSWQGGLLSGLLGAAVCCLPFFLVWYLSGGKWMGFGDVKFAVFFGLALGWPLGLVGLFLSVFIGGIAGVILLIFTNKTLKSQVPFGTFLSIGVLATLFYGPALLHWYLGLIGV